MTRAVAMPLQRPRRPGIGTDQHVPSPARPPRAVPRASVDLAAIGVVEHALLLARVPPGRRRAVVAALDRHPLVVGCSGFMSEPNDLVVEVAADRPQAMQELVDWARTTCGLQVDEYLPIEKVLFGGPDRLPEFGP